MVRNAANQTSLRQPLSAATALIVPMIFSLGGFLMGAHVGGCTGSPTASPTPTPSPSVTPTASPTPTPEPSLTELPPDDQRRRAIQSSCGQNALACTGTRPIPDIDIDPGPDQFLTFSDGAVVITGKSESGVELVRLIGSNSIPGAGIDAVTFSWSYGATDTNRDSLTPGIEFSRAPDVLVGMAVGFHYVRLTVRNGDELAGPNFSPDDLDADFIELAIEIRTSDSPFLAKPNQPPPP